MPARPAGRDTPRASCASTSASDCTPASPPFRSKSQPNRAPQPLAPPFPRSPITWHAKSSSPVQNPPAKRAESFVKIIATIRAPTMTWHAKSLGDERWTFCEVFPVHLFKLPGEEAPQLLFSGASSASSAGPRRFVQRALVGLSAGLVGLFSGPRRLLQRPLRLLLRPRLGLRRRAEGGRCASRGRRGARRYGGHSPFVAPAGHALK